MQTTAIGKGEFIWKLEIHGGNLVIGVGTVELWERFSLFLEEVRDEQTDF